MKAINFQNKLKSCNLCPLSCHINRNNNELGKCKVGKLSKVFNCTLFFDDIKKFSPSYGIFFAGCNLNCCFCPFHYENKLNEKYEVINKDFISKINKEIEIQKPKSISFLGGEATIHLYEILKIIENLKNGLPLLIYTNLYFNNSLCKILKEHFEYVIADFHFGTNLCAYNLSKAKNYFEVAKENVLSLKGKIILRHLLLPGHIDCCFKSIIDFLRKHSPELEIVLITQYFPYFGFKSEAKPNKFIEKKELERAINYAKNSKINLKIYENNLDLESDFEHFSKFNEIIIDEKGKIAFKYPDGFALSLKKVFAKGENIGH